MVARTGEIGRLSPFDELQQIIYIIGQEVSAHSRLAVVAWEIWLDTSH